LRSPSHFVSENTYRACTICCGECFVQGAIPRGNATKENIAVHSSSSPNGQVIYRCPKCNSIKPNRAHHCRSLTLPGLVAVINKCLLYRIFVYYTVDKPQQIQVTNSYVMYLQKQVSNNKLIDEKIRCPSKVS